MNDTADLRRYACEIVAAWVPTHAICVLENALTCEFCTNRNGSICLVETKAGDMRAVERADARSLQKQKQSRLEGSTPLAICALGNALSQTKACDMRAGERADARIVSDQACDMRPGARADARILQKQKQSRDPTSQPWGC